MAGMGSWRAADVKFHHLDIQQLNGMSNSCYRVAIVDPELSSVEPQVLLYRKFECEIVSRDLESTVFGCMAEAGLGPKLYYQDEHYRLEGFFKGKALTVWELANPYFNAACAELIYKFHHEAGIADSVAHLAPLNKQRLGIDIAIDEWGPKSIERIPRMREQVNNSSLSEEDKLKILHALDVTEEVCLFPGFQQFFARLVEREDVIFSHNDVQENNILKALSNNEKVLLIDYEYANWNPLTYDLGNYLNEHVCDNAHPEGCGIAYYH